MNANALKGAKSYTASQAREKFADLFDTAFFGEPVVVTKRDRTVALVSLALLERLMELEAESDNKAAEAALEEFQQKGGKTMKQIKQELDMD